MAKATKPVAIKLSRAERRERQRVENPARAKKMHEARLTMEEPYLFAPPAVRGKVGRNKVAPVYHIGCSGWYYWDWKGAFYPATMPTSQWFEHYTDNFDSVELNAPFYSWPTLATVRGWMRQIKEKPFIYTVKVCELITHVKQFRGTKTLVKDFGLIADILGPHMGCFLFQVPPSFRYSAARLKNIVEQLDPARRNVVEFRHASWWNEKVYAAFREANIIFCSCSAPRLPDELVTTADDIYVRFHGTQKWYRHDYSDEEIEVWAQRIRASGARQVWIYFNNDFDGYAIKNAHELERRLQDAMT